ncbi:glutaredoxin [Coccidioides immitis RS]|uniref:Glutaredoxin n=3 Tax=Coccidioides immitis TaxID=5501 RepID=J3K9R3_COCIM|nr:glutaredoxin [Coccidioides immitis RS]EAS31685.3 glutaredoxin [Coccidioides immitis RS]KMP04344.1 glutaredoxin [Coccidioides immitis RMSCC 2394]KMU91009.1 glutaredoxin [Coccidioides immitis H538.4]TPX24433.1 hypothetical protein DIZ76_013780 [Coccidioides immitis]
MSPYRRIKLLLISVFLIVLLILYLTADQRRIQNQRIYQKTVEALDAKHARKVGQQEDDGVMFQKLKPGKLKPEDKQAIAVDRQRYESPVAPKGDSEGEQGGGSVAGRVKVPPSDEKGKDVPKQESDSKEVEIEAEFNSILKRSPIIIFSKSYCPYSRKAKYILLEKYSIVPAPFVVELDEHPLGQELQALLSSNTGRRTVPNVLINGKSIGGGDDIEALDISRELAPKIKQMVGRRLVEAKRIDDKPV